MFGADTIAEFERAAEARFQEATLLMQHGFRGAAAYLFGCCAELVVKAAAFRFLGLGPHDRITKAVRDQVWNDAVNIMGIQFRKDGHDAPGWAKWLAEARKRVAAAYDPAWEADLLQHSGTAHAVWLPDMRYRELEAVISDADPAEISRAVRWLISNRDRF